MKRRCILFCVLTYATPLIGQNWVSTVTPIQNQIDVVLDADVRIVFTQDLDPSSVTDEAIKIHGRQTGFYTASLGYDQAARTATLMMATPFRAGELVTILEDISNLKNNLEET